MKKHFYFSVCLFALMGIHGIGYAAGIRSCSEPNNGVPPTDMPWLPLGADKNTCNQTYSQSATPVTSATDWPNSVAAYKGGKLVGFRWHDLRTKEPFLFQHDWEDVGRAVDEATLWWGRNDDTHMFVGQESFLRLDRRPAPMSAADIAKLTEDLKRKIAALKSGQPQQKEALGPDTSGLFLRNDLQYEQIAATQTTFRGGFGGSANEGPAPLGKVTGANLKLDATGLLVGQLTLTLSMDGINRVHSVPVMSNTRSFSNLATLPPVERFRLRAGILKDGKIVRCEEHPPGDTLCRYPQLSIYHFQEGYALYGAFFGDHAQYVAIQYLFRINQHQGPRKSITARGLLVLALKQSTAPLGTTEQSSPLAKRSDVSEASLVPTPVQTKEKTSQVGAVISTAVSPEGILDVRAKCHHKGKFEDINPSGQIDLIVENNIVKLMDAQIDGCRATLSEFKQVPMNNNIVLKNRSGCFIVISPGPSASSNRLKVNFGVGGIEECVNFCPRLKKTFWQFQIDSATQSCY